MASYCDRCWIKMQVKSPSHLAKISKRKEVKQLVQHHEAKQTHKAVQTAWSHVLLSGSCVFTEVITLQTHAFRQRHMASAATVNQRHISWLIHCSQWISSAESSLPVTPGIHPNSNIPNQGWAWSLSCSPRTPLSHISQWLAKSGFLWAMFSWKKLLCILETGALYCNFCIKRK